MWELYAFWGFVPFAIKTFNNSSGNENYVPMWSAIIIAFGGVSCILGGLLSLRYGSKKVAVVSLLVSGALCLLSPVLFDLSTFLFLICFCIWGMAVTADSPQFSSMAAAVPAELKGTALTLLNCIGFAISIISIELISSLAIRIDPKHIFLVLAIGPILGLWQMLDKSVNF